MSVFLCILFLLSFFVYPFLKRRMSKVVAQVSWSANGHSSEDDDEQVFSLLAMRVDDPDTPISMFSFWEGNEDVLANFEVKEKLRAKKNLPTNYPTCWWGMNRTGKWGVVCPLRHIESQQSPETHDVDPSSEVAGVPPEPVQVLAPRSLTLAAPRPTGGGITSPKRRRKTATKTSSFVREFVAFGGDDPSSPLSSSRISSDPESPTLDHSVGKGPVAEAFATNRFPQTWEDEVDVTDGHTGSTAACIRLFGQTSDLSSSAPAAVKLSKMDTYINEETLLGFFLSQPDTTTAQAFSKNLSKLLIKEKLPCIVVVGDSRSVHVLSHLKDPQQHCKNFVLPCCEGHVGVLAPSSYGISERGEVVQLQNTSNNGWFACQLPKSRKACIICRSLVSVSVTRKHTHIDELQFRTDVSHVTRKYTGESLLESLREQCAEDVVDSSMMIRTHRNWLMPKAEIIPSTGKKSAKKPTGAVLERFVEA